MTCERCQGLMVGERICDLQGTNGDFVWTAIVACCGNVVDATILKNRRQSTEALDPLTVYNPRGPRLVAT